MAGRRGSAIEPLAVAADANAFRAWRGGNRAVTQWRIFAVLLVGCLFVWACGKSEAPEDPRAMEGWRSFHFGTPTASAESAASRERLSIAKRSKNDKGETVWSLSPVSIDGVSFNPHLRFAAPSGNLEAVVLFCDEEVATSSQYDRIETMLIKQLGPTTTVKHDDNMAAGMAIKQARWSFPKTTVTARFFGSTAKAGNALFISYEDPSIVTGE